MGGMKNFAARTGPLLLALLSVAMAVPGCAGVFDKCVKPEIAAATKLAPGDVAKDVAAFLICDGGNSGMVPPCAVAALASLAEALGPGGEEAVNCIVSYYENNGTGLLKARAKAVGAKRGVTPELYGTHACNGILKKNRGALQVAASQGPANYDPGLSGRPDIISHAICDSACGAPLTGLATSTGCSCWRASKTDSRKSRWVALARRTPPAGGAGLVGGGGV